tara:strand:- start:359 stop:1090 length:732 start_codon:yes stop_codon:yes gene_type:complete
MRILIIGESCKDVFHYGTCDRLCPEAPVPVFKSIELVDNGGMAMNVYSNLCSFEIKPDIVTNKNWKTITKTRFVDKRANHMFMRLDENDDNYGSCDLSDINFNLYDAVIVSDYNKGFLTKEDLKFISLNHSLTFLDTKKKLGTWAENYKFIKINNKEYDLSKPYLNKKIEEILIVTQGPKGCFYKDKNYTVPLVEVKDTSGAGDTFMSALCYKFCQTKNIDLAINFANKCATQVVQKIGVAII